MSHQKPITRRHFLQSAAVTAAGLGFFPLLSVSKGNPLKSKVTVGAHPWVYAAPLPEFDITPVLDQIFADMQYAGMEGVELMHHPFRKAEATERIGALSETYKLPVIGTSYSADMWDRDQHNEILEDAELIITNLAKVGGRTLGTSVGDTPEPKTEQQLDDQAALLKKIIGICNDNGVVLNLHNHTYEVENNMHDLKGTLRRIPDVKLGPDLNWLVRGGVDPVDFIREYGYKMVSMHLRDQYQDGKWTEYLGQGDLNFKAIAKALKDVNFSGDVVIELAHERNFEPTQPIRESLKKSREFVKKMMGF